MTLLHQQCKVCAALISERSLIDVINSDKPHTEVASLFTMANHPVTETSIRRHRKFHSNSKLVVDKSDRQIKILTIDIERLPGLARVWEQKTRFVPITNFVRMPSMLCFAAKWYDSDEMMFYSAWDNPKEMIEESWQLYNEADVIVTYNGRRFDNKHLKSEWLMANMPPPKPWKDVDLFMINSQNFGFESKSLNHLCKQLGLNTKSGHYDADMAEACLAGDAEAQKTMRIYNEGDVSITEQAYDRLMPWIKSHPHVKDDAKNVTCNKCGSTDLVSNGTYLASQFRYDLFRCRTCGGSVRGTKGTRIANSYGV